ncbi:MAG: hypothetical protein H7Z41_04365 [Cytophagales bacterium]|nr:hypothetical protein [Armatimonadota bacterium]
MKPVPTHFWHTLPLHYVPHLLASGILFSQDALQARGLPIRPRATAAQRDRRLGVSRFVHLSFTAKTPLLADKRIKGYPHALITFDAALSASETAAYLPYNTKSWRHRDDFVPIYDREAKAALIQQWRGGRYPSAELLIETMLPLIPHGAALHLASEEEAAWLCGLIAFLGIKPPLPICVSPEQFPPGLSLNLDAHNSYAEACRASGSLLPPPNVTFD